MKIYYYATYLYFLYYIINTILYFFNQLFLNNNNQLLLKYLNIKNNKKYLNFNVLCTCFIMALFITIINISITIQIYYEKTLIIKLPHKTIDLVSKMNLNVKYIYIIYIFLNFASLFLKFVKKKDFICMILSKNNSKPIKNNKKYYFSDYESIDAGDMCKNILITGSIGSGKTSTGILSFLTYFNRNNINGLILDVKGNLVNSVLKIFNNNKVNIISFEGNCRYNPLNKIEFSEYELASYIRNVIEITSNNYADSFWLEKVQNTLQAIIVILRLTDRDVNFYNIHQLINDERKLNSILEEIKVKYIKNRLSKENKCKYEFALIYFKHEFNNLDNRVSSIIKSEITRITIPFISDSKAKDIFCKDSNIDFSDDKITVLSFNIGINKSISKIISAFIKEDFQRYILTNFNREKEIFFICDEYQEFALKSDGEYLALSREAKCINLFAMQSYTSLNNKLKDKDAANIIIQNCINKIFYRQDDVYTIQELIKYIGKRKSKYVNETVTQNSNNISYNLISNNINNYKKGISHSISYNEVLENVLSEEYLSRKMKTFEAIVIINSNNNNYDQPLLVNMKEVKKINEENYISVSSASSID